MVSEGHRGVCERGFQFYCSPGTCSEAVKRQLGTGSKTFTQLISDTKRHKLEGESYTISVDKCLLKSVCECGCL